MRSLGAQFWPGLRDAYPVQRRFRGGEGTVFAVRTCTDVQADLDAAFGQVNSLIAERLGKCALTGSVPAPVEVLGNEPESQQGEGAGGTSDCESLDQQIHDLYMKIADLITELDTCLTPAPKTAPA